VFPPVQYHYNGFGNLTQRGTTAITFEPDKPHFVDTVDDNEYDYDANGNVQVRAGPDVPGGTQTITYTPFDLPSEIATATGDVVNFEYSADEERLVRRSRLLGVETMRHFVSDLYQRVIVGGASTMDTLEERFRVFAGTRLIAEIVRKDGVADQTLFFHDDHQGTPTAITTDSGQAFEQNFTPFGALATSTDPDLTRTGFTGHQHEWDLDLIDMRGRMYDPLASRFLSADPFVQKPFVLESRAQPICVRFQ
jgi:RHS repeat-associated protein